MGYLPQAAMTASVYEKPSDTSAGRCPLCRAGPPAFHYRDSHREYLRCALCALVFVPERDHLAPEEERRRYGFHRNSPRDEGYRRFLARLFEPVAARLAPGACGLDFGCGPAPVLADMFEAAGFAMEVYDPWFAPSPEVLDRRYDFVTCSEAAEHFRNPAFEWRRLAGLLQPGGCLGVMTQLLDEEAAFDDWYYKNDPTHVSFYAPRSVAWIAAAHDLRPLLVSSSVFLLQARDFAPPRGAV